MSSPPLYLVSEGSPALLDPKVLHSHPGAPFIHNHSSHSIRYIRDKIVNIKGKKLIPKFVQWRLKHQPFPHVTLKSKHSCAGRVVCYLTRPSDHSSWAISPSKGFYKKRGAKGATLGQALSISMVAHDAHLDGRVSQREGCLGIARVQRKSPLQGGDTQVTWYWYRSELS